MELIKVLADVSQVALAILAGCALRQITVAKNDIKIRSQREARLLSMELGEKFAKEIVPAMNDYYNKIISKGFKFIQVGMDNFYKEDVEKFSPEERNIFELNVNFFKANKDLLDLSMHVLNLLEAFSMNFIQRVADEEAIFTAASQTYCDFVEKNFAVLCVLRNKDKYNYYENTVALYQVWSSRIKKKGLSIQHEGIMVQLNKISNHNKITPIGA